MPSQSAYIIAARRTAIGRIGGLHRNRRIEELCAPLVGVALQDSGLEPGQVDELIVGNATQGGNPARLIALAAGLPEAAPAATIDRQCGSGLDAILAAVRAVSLGDAQAIVAGGAEAISMAPWRVAKPRNLQQLPRFLSYEPGSGEEREGPAHIESAEALAIKHGIGRAEQDAYALRSYLKAEQAREHKRFVGEIAPLRANPDEARDQSSVAPDFKDLAQLAPYMPPDGTLTPGNTASLHDGAAVAVVVSKNMWTSLGKPRGLRLLAHAARGTAPDDEAAAPIEAMQKLRAKLRWLQAVGHRHHRDERVFRRAGHCAYPQPRNRRGPSQSGRRRHRARTSVRGVELRSGYASFHAHGARRRRRVPSSAWQRWASPAAWVSRHCSKPSNDFCIRIEQRAYAPSARDACIRR